MQFLQHPRAVGLHYHATVPPKSWKKSTLAERVQYVLDEMEWTEAEFARQVGARGQSAVQHWTIGRNKTIKPKFAWPLQDKHRWSARWLLDGEGEPRIPFVEAEKQKLIERVSSLPAERLKALAELIGV